ncbi:MAG: Cas10/Cmr2 second palm domain-containing protein [Mycoplasmatales bacterium]
MYIVKFITNSNQEFINQPFEATDNKKKQQQIIMQSKNIEDFTYNVLQEFIEYLDKVKVPDKVRVQEKLKIKKLRRLMNKNIEKHNFKLLEFTSGKILFLINNITEEDIKKIFHNILEEQIKSNNKNHKQTLISFCYDYIQVDREPKNYQEVVEKFRGRNEGYNFINNNFSLLFKRENKEYTLDNNKNSDIDSEAKIDLEELLNVGSLQELKNSISQNININSYTEIKNKKKEKEKEEYVVNKFFIFKLDLNNIGVNFSLIKNIDFSEYSKISLKFFELIRVSKINKDLEGLKIKNYCRCMFAAGDDIIFVTRLDKLTDIIEYLKDIMSKINELFKEIKDKVNVTIAGGLLQADYRLPIRLYYDKVEELLSNAKEKSKKEENKEKNILHFNNTNYEFSKMQKLICNSEKIIIAERQSQDIIKSSSFFYNLINKLISNLDINYEILVLSELENNYINLHDNTKIILVRQLQELEKEEFIDMLRIMLSLSYLPFEKEYKEKVNEEYSELAQEEFLKIIKDTEIALTDLEIFGNFIGIQYELLEIERKGELSSAEYEKKILSIIFRKDNSLYMRLDNGYLKRIKEFTEFTKKKRKNYIYSNILAIKYGKKNLEELNNKLEEKNKGGN